MSRSHNHENCDRCTDGVVFGFCDYEDCGNEFCVEYGHCSCNCHSGKTCACGYYWPRMEKLNV